MVVRWRYRFRTLSWKVRLGLPFLVWCFTYVTWMVLNIIVDAFALNAWSLSLRVLAQGCPLTGESPGLNATGIVLSAVICLVSGREDYGNER